MIVLFPSDSSVTSVTVSPTAVTVSAGQSATFTAAVEGTGIVSKSVTWSVTGSTPLASGTHITNGALYVAVDETNTELTVTATSTADVTKSGTGKVTLA